MSLSAKQLGEKIGLNAQEMNALLKEEGYLSGEPGNYNVTSKGDSYVSEKSWSNGYGGYAARGYSYNVWDESILDGLDTSNENLNVIREKTSLERKQRRAENEKRSQEYWQAHSPLYKKDNINDDNICEKNKEQLEISGTELIIGIGIVAGVSYLTYLGYSKIKNMYIKHKHKKELQNKQD